MLHESLWTANLDLARACLECTFVRQLAGGTLPAGAFRRYVAQDAFFLRAFLGAYALLAARVERIEDAAAFVDLQQGVVEELKLHAGYAASLGIDLTGVEPLPPTRAYCDFLARLAWTAPAAEALAGMVPCMRLYAWLGAELGRGGLPDHAYRDWIATYGGPEFASLARRIEELLDRLASDTPAVRQAYRYAMTCEQAFFEAPLAGA